VKAEVRSNTVGSGFKYVEPCNIYGCEIGDNVFIGPFVEIQRGTVIGKNSRIQSHSFICEDTVIGDDCFIGHGVVFVNDKFTGGKRAFGDRSKWGKVVIGNSVNIGSNSTIMPVRITDNVTIGAGSVVTKDIMRKGIYAGNPARFLKECDE